MADVANTETKSPTAAATSEGKKSKKVASTGATKKPRTKPTHPPTAQMVNSAIKSLKERSGSSLPAIKKYLTANYEVDAEKLAPFIKKYLKTAVANGNLIQTKGKGASGSFKLPSLAKAQKSESGEPAKKKKKSPVKKLKEKVTKSPKKKVEKKKTEKKKISTTVIKTAKKVNASTLKIKTSKPKVPKPKKEKATKAAPKSPKTPKPKKLATAKKPATKKATKKAAA